LRLPLDTHALIVWLAGDDALSRRAREAIADEANSVAVSAASAMEVSTKFRIGKLRDAALLAQDFEGIVAAQGFTELAITVHHARLAGEMNIAMLL
jgi:PIN domain nuclease of toxin-antitoxin system